jgi:stage V sporulation protein G
MQKLTNNQDGNKQGKVVIFVIVTDVRVRKVLAEGKMKAIVSVTLDDSFVIHDVKVVEGQNGLFVAMPSRKTPDGEFRDIAHPINTSASHRLSRYSLPFKIKIPPKKKGEGLFISLHYSTFPFQIFLF